MRKWITFLMTLLVGSSVAASAFAIYPEVKASAGYRRDDLSWTTKAPSHDPFIENKSNFKDLDIFVIDLSGKFNLGCGFYLRASADYGWILDGNFDDKLKFFFSGPEPLSSNAVEFTTDKNNIIDGNHVFDVDVAIGYPCYFCDCTGYVAPVVGYAFNEQNLEIDSEHVFSLSESDGFIFPETKSECCDAKFVNRWYGPFVGLDFQFLPYDCWSLFAKLEYHWAHLKAKRNTHNGVHFADDLHKISKHAHGWVFEVAADYQWDCCWTVGLSYKYTDFGVSDRHHLDDSFSSQFSSSDFASSSWDDDFRTSNRWRSNEFKITLGRRF